MKEDNPLLDYNVISNNNISNAGSSSSSNTRTTVNFCKTQANVSWTMVIFVSLAALFYIIFFVLVVNTTRAGNYVSFVVAFVGYFLLAAIAVLVLIWFSKDDGLSFQRSSPWIFVLSIIRCTEYMTMMVIEKDSSTLEAIEALAGSWGFFFGLSVVNAIIREYFGEPPDLDNVPSSAQSFTTRRSPYSTHRRSKGFVFSRGPDRGQTPEEAKKIQDRISAPATHEDTKKQNTALTADQYLKAIFGCCIVLTILVFLPADSAWVILFLTLSTGVTVALGFLLIRQLFLELAYISNNEGYLMFARTHTNGLVVLALLIAMSARVILDGVELIIGVDLIHYQPNVNADSFLNFAKETTTELFPIALHFFNIIRMKKGITANAGERLKWLIYIVLLTLHFVCIAYVEDSYYHEAFGVILATTAGYLAALDFALLLLIIISPIAHLFFPTFNFGNLRARMHSFHFHRKLAYSSLIFALIHIVAHIITWAAIPNLLLQNGKHMYSLSRPYLYTGVIMIIGFIGSFQTGRNPNATSSSKVSNFSYHSFFAASVVLAFSVHGSGSVLGLPVGDYVVLGVAFLSTLLVSFYFAFYPTRKAEVDLIHSVCLRSFDQGHRAKKKVYFLLLVTSNPIHQPVPPGSLFNIFDKRGGSYPFLHAHPFPVFSSSPKKLVFFIRCRFSKSKTRPSFTRMLYKNVGNGSYKSLQIQGPICGSSTVTSSFIQYLVGVPTKTDVYLCGANAGFSSVFSLLEHLRGNCNMYNIQSIFCTYYVESERARAHLHEYVDELVESWNSFGEALLVIVEAPDLLLSLKCFSENAKAIIAHSKRVDGETYILDLLKEKYDKNTKPEPEQLLEVAHWVALGKDVVENKVVTWDDDEWEDIDAEGVRRKGKDANVKEDSNGYQQINSSPSELGIDQPTKALYNCGVDLDYEFFSENWKIFNDLTSPNYKSRSAFIFEQDQLTKSGQSSPYNPQSTEVSYQNAQV